MAQCKEHFILPIGDGTVRSRSVWSLEEVRTGLNQKMKDDGEARNDFWWNVEPRGHLCVPKKETFPIPLKYIDVTRTTHTNLDVLQESRIDDDWNIAVDQILSDSWAGFTTFTFLNEKPPRQ